MRSIAANLGIINVRLALADGPRLPASWSRAACPGSSHWNQEHESY